MQGRGESYVIDMSQANVPMPSLTKTAGAVGALLLGINTLTSHETHNRPDADQAQLAAQSKAIALSTPRCEGKPVEMLTTALTPCQNRELGQQIAAEREAMRGQVAFNREASR